MSTDHTDIFENLEEILRMRGDDRKNATYRLAREYADDMVNFAEGQDDVGFYGLQAALCGLRDEKLVIAIKVFNQLSNCGVYEDCKSDGGFVTNSYAANVLMDAFEAQPQENKLLIAEALSRLLCSWNVDSETATRLNGLITALAGSISDEVFSHLTAAEQFAAQQ